MRCQHVNDDLQCRSDATRRVLVGCGDPPDPDQAGFAGTVYMVMVCKQHDPDLRRSMPLPRPPGSVPIGERPRRYLSPCSGSRSASVLPRAGPTGLHRTGVGQSTDSIGRPTSIRSWLDPPFLVSRVHGSPAAAAVAGLPQPSPKGQQSGSHGGRCRCPALLVPCPSANVPGGRNQAAPAETLLPGLHRLPP